MTVDVNRSPFAKDAKFFDQAGQPATLSVVVPLLKNAAGQWPERIITSGVRYDFDQALTDADTSSGGDQPCYKEQPST